MLKVLAILTALGPGGPEAARAQEIGIEPPAMTLIQRREEIIRDTQQRIQTEILDRILGKGRASVFVDVEFDMKASRKNNLRAGSGVAEKNKQKGAGGAGKTEFLLPGLPKKRDLDEEGGKRPEAAQGQTAAQVKTLQEELFTQEEVFKKFLVTVIHDAGVMATQDGKNKLDEVRELIVEALAKYKIQKDDIVLRAANYHIPQKNWFDDILEPRVYLPLLYAALLLMLLFFLFGPVASFLRRYTTAMVQKPAAEINVESNIEPPEDLGQGEGDNSGQSLEESALDILVGQKPTEPPPPPDEEDEEDDMAKKFEPFAYITEDNLKKLANLFLVGNEEPWLIAVVLSYLNPDYARRVLTALPVELQAKVAIEALKVRQVTREQIIAIDADVKENIDFVVGGIERLIQMIEEADPQTRANILESLQNEKPVVYEHVRNSILLFEDIARFADRDMQGIVRELKAEDMARALENAPPEVVNKFLKNMSSGAASTLKEIMEYQKDLTQAQIEDERARIVDQIKSLEKKGKVTISNRGGKSEGFREVMAAESASGGRLSHLAGGASGGRSGGAPRPRMADPVRDAAPAAATPDPARAQKVYDEGVTSHQAGNLDEAVRLFREAIELDPELWDAYQYLGQGLYQTGRTTEAVMYYEKYLEHHPDPDLQSWVESTKAQA